MPTGRPASTTISAVMAAELTRSSAEAASASGEMVFGAGVMISSTRRSRMSPVAR